MIARFKVSLKHILPNPGFASENFLLCMKTIITTLILAASLGWGPASEIIHLGQTNVAAMNATAINQAAQLAAIKGQSFDPSGQDALAVIEQLHGLGYLSEIDAQKMRQTADRLQPTGTFGVWSDVEFAVGG